MRATFKFGYPKEVRISGVLGVKFNHVYFFVNSYCVGDELIKIIQENCLKIRSIFLCPSAKSRGVNPATFLGFLSPTCLIIN